MRVGAKTGWRLAWETMVRELAPQDQTGSYSRPKYAFDEQIGSPRFPVSVFLSDHAVSTPAEQHNSTFHNAKEACNLISPAAGPPAASTVAVCYSVPELLDDSYMWTVIQQCC